MLIAGAVDSGKSSLSKILLSYSARNGTCPTFVDLGKEGEERRKKKRSKIDIIYYEKKKIISL